MGGPARVFLVAVGRCAAIVGFFGFTFRVNPDELGVVLRFGKFVRQQPPGLHFRLPYPIEEVRAAQGDAQNIIEIGMRSARPSTAAPRAACATCPRRA